jgi:hypothetical protein
MTRRPKDRTRLFEGKSVRAKYGRIKDTTSSGPSDLTNKTIFTPIPMNSPHNKTVVFDRRAKSDADKFSNFWDLYLRQINVVRK